MFPSQKNEPGERVARRVRWSISSRRLGYFDAMFLTVASRLSSIVTTFFGSGA